MYDKWSTHSGPERTNGLVILRLRGHMDYYAGIMGINGLDRVGAIGQMVWLLWDREGTWTGYTGTERITIFSGL